MNTTSPKDSIVIDFSADGAVEAMHKDSFPLGFLGKQEITRASEIKFNEETQKWDIWPNVEGHFYNIQFCTGFDTYDGARKIEVAWFEGCRLESVPIFSGRSYEIFKQKRKELGV